MRRHIGVSVSVDQRVGVGVSVYRYIGASVYGCISVSVCRCVVCRRACVLSAFICHRLCAQVFMLFVCDYIGPIHGFLAAQVHLCGIRSELGYENL